jgi:hypothetical protein
MPVFSNTIFIQHEGSRLKANIIFTINAHRAVALCQDRVCLIENRPGLGWDYVFVPGYDFDLLELYTPRIGTTQVCNNGQVEPIIPEYQAPQMDKHQVQKLWENFLNLLGAYDGPIGRRTASTFQTAVLNEARTFKAQFEEIV